MDVAINPTSGGAEASLLVPLLQPAVMSATAARPTTALRRYAIVLMDFLSRHRRGFRVSPGRTLAPAGTITERDERRRRSRSS